MEPIDLSRIPPPPPSWMCLVLSQMSTLFSCKADVHALQVGLSKASHHMHSPVKCSQLTDAIGKGGWVVWVCVCGGGGGGTLYPFLPNPFWLIALVQTLRAPWSCGLAVSFATVRYSLLLLAWY
jgi:hypothetical protein